MRRGNIEAERARRDITQLMMCKMLRISTDSYNRYVNKGEPIPSDKLEKMAQIFGVTTDYLLQPTESWPRESA